ncbi:ABC transporter permease [Haloprofundus salinisoli]|uniref:ABC transporter permease n=1 Tax=Haloprofundus salinisoli TaxID=2876193 RepID=UPI001CC91C1D|nr:ABC transporter permease [Haloprofundus salinisoli]
MSNARSHEYVGTRARIVDRIRGDTLAMVGGVIVAGVFAVALFSAIDEFLLNRQLVTMVVADPYETNRFARLLAPSLEHPFGTDEQGRDIFARTLYGTRTSVVVGLAAVGFASVVGIVVGSITAYYGGLTDMVGMRAMDVLLSFPSILLAIALMAILGRGLENVIFAIAIVYVPTFARITRSEVLSEKSEQYVGAARAMGYPDTNIVSREILPNSLTPIIVQFTFSMATAIIAEAALSFLGLGVSPIHPTWGIMLSGARQYITSAWWYSVFPGLAIMVTVLGFNLLGDSLRDALDPQQQRDAEGRM